MAQSLTVMDQHIERHIVYGRGDGCGLETYRMQSPQYRRRPISIDGHPCAGGRGQQRCFRVLSGRIDRPERRREDRFDRGGRFREATPISILDPPPLDPSAPSVQFDGNPNSKFGSSAIVAGDIDADGLPDIAISSSVDGVVYIFKGRAWTSGTVLNASSADYKIVADASFAGANFGYCPGPAG